MAKPYFSVFTPTYNRAHTLGRLYESLLAQTFMDFEWLIVDDGSLDETAGLVRSWQVESPFLIRYFYQENQGKHAAWNFGTTQALGELFLIVDSDDACVSEALERIKHHWENIPKTERHLFSSLTFLCKDRNEKTIGGKFPEDVIDSNSPWERFSLNYGGDRGEVFRTDVLNAYPFPEIPDETFMPEGLVPNRMAFAYKVRFVNDLLKVVEYLSDGLSASSVRIRANSPQGARLYYRELCQYPIPLHMKTKPLINYLRFSFHGKVPFSRMIEESVLPAAATVLLPIGYLMFKVDRRALKSGSPGSGRL